MARMENVIREILEYLREGRTVDDALVAQILTQRNRAAAAPVRRFAKKHLVPYYLDTKAHDLEKWKSWDVDANLEARFLAALRMKPRRTASGVATITVITKPWPCANNCLYCPNDVRMPKSYLHDEPACQRAERNCFDPYLQVAARLRALQDMGHITDKIELIVLGGTWSDYPRGYQIWFAQQLFAALNDDDDTRFANAVARRNAYDQLGIEGFPETRTRKGPAGKAASGFGMQDEEPHRTERRGGRQGDGGQDFSNTLPPVQSHDGDLALDAEAFCNRCSFWQHEVDTGKASYNEAVRELYGASRAWQSASAWQTAGMDELMREHRRNEDAAHRVVGLVVETRPDTVSVENLRLIRQLGATKVQMGIQSLDARVLAANRRNTDEAVVQRAIDLTRLFGFKVHTHFMVNLLGATPEGDKADYARFATQTPYQPDEVKLYPCALVAGTGLQACYEKGTWRPYTEEELLDVLVADTIATPEFTRISRMIRDISAGDIVAGNKKANLRQLVEAKAADAGQPIREMRHRELNTAETSPAELELRETHYDTLSTHEVFLQWVTPENRIAGFLRLSLPDPQIVADHPELPVLPGQAMIREVHVYGRVAGIGDAGTQTREETTIEQATTEGQRQRASAACAVPNVQADEASARARSATSEEQEARTESQQPRTGADNAAPNAQHAGLGRRLVQRACEIAAAEGYRSINVISAVGTRNYYRNLGFHDSGLYLAKDLSQPRA